MKLSGEPQSASMKPTRQLKLFEAYSHTLAYMNKVMMNERVNVILFLLPLIIIIMMMMIIIIIMIIIALSAELINSV